MSITTVASCPFNQAASRPKIADLLDIPGLAELAFELEIQHSRELTRPANFQAGDVHLLNPWDET